MKMAVQQGKRSPKGGMKFFAEGIWFSDNGRKAYQRGERPLFLIPSDTVHSWRQTIPHHICKLGLNSCRVQASKQWVFKLVMFYEQIK